MALSIGFISAFILTVLTISAVLLSKTMVSKGVIGEFQAIANANGKIVESMLEEPHESSVYGYHLTKKAFEVEGYYTNLISSTVKSNNLFHGMGIFFEPYAFDSDIKDCAIYIDHDNVESKSYKSFAFIDDYSSNEWYSGTIEAVENGTNLADKTANSLSQVVEKAELVTDKVQKIAIASSEQSTAIAQVTIGMEQIFAAVQTNSATSEESAAASEELAEQANLLNTLIKRFKLLGISVDISLDIVQEHDRTRNDTRDCSAKDL